MAKVVVQKFSLVDFVNGASAVDPRAYDFLQVRTPSDLADGIIGAEVASSMQLLRNNITSALHLTDVFRTTQPTTLPIAMADNSVDPYWWPPANAVRRVCDHLGIYLCSYASENGGELFVHLAPQSGTSASAEKSRGKLRGHTDAVAFPFPHEALGEHKIAPSPDYVILVCLSNPSRVPTRIAPLSTIVRKLPKEVLDCLREPIFDIYPQISFKLKPGYKLTQVPIIYRDSLNGDGIRFSHTTIVPSSGSNSTAAAALAELQAAVAKSYRNVVLHAGDVLIVNNRTSIHGRGVVASETVGGGQKRWLLRTYGVNFSPQRFSLNAATPFVLAPAAGGPL